MWWGGGGGGGGVLGAIRTRKSGEERCRSRWCGSTSGGSGRRCSALSGTTAPPLLSRASSPAPSSASPALYPCCNVCTVRPLPTPARTPAPCSPYIQCTLPLTLHTANSVSLSRLHKSVFFLQCAKNLQTFLLLLLFLSLLHFLNFAITSP